MPTSDEKFINVRFMDERKIIERFETNFGTFFKTTDGKILKVSRDASLIEKASKVFSEVVEEHLNKDGSKGIEAEAVATICVSDPVGNHAKDVIIIVPGQLWDDLTEATKNN